MKVEWNPDAFYDIRRSDAAVAAVEDYAQSVADRANSNGEGTYSVGSQQGQRKPQGRWRASVVTADYAAMRDNAENNTLLRSM